MLVYLLVSSRKIKIYAHFSFSLKKVPTTEVILMAKEALLHKDLKCKAPLIEPNLRRNLGKW
ncbi:hypothetical protein KTH50_16130, partial [Acinetobacter ursingii]|nr:hypothetical protein [Acinetobacter ursingii]